MLAEACDVINMRLDSRRKRQDPSTAFGFASLRSG